MITGQVSPILGFELCTLAFYIVTCLHYLVFPPPELWDRGRR